MDRQGSWSRPPLLVGRSWRVVCEGAPPARDGRLDVVLTRGAFGSGEHETTASCLEILEGVEGIAGTALLDLGSGTGILAIAALKLGARSALLVDIDGRAVATSRRCCELNGVSVRVQHLQGELTAVTGEGRFGLVLANIHADILVAVAADLVELTERGGLLLLSGILWEDAYTVRSTYERLGCTPHRQRMLDEYCTLLLRRDGGSPTPGRG